MKEERQRTIAEIVSKKDIFTQNDLMIELERYGIHATQATVSRDIKDLRLTREPTGRGTYRYALPEVRPQDTEEKLRSIFRECVTSITAAGNLVVIKTLPGLAPAACGAIDRMTINDLAGTIAGDDTAFLALTSEKAAGDLCAQMRGLL